MSASTAIKASKTLSQTPFDINVRDDLRWDYSKVGKVFVEGDPLISCLWAAFSICAPPIERFFVKALKPTVDTITGDAKLSADVKCMLAQEVNHAAAHMKFNKHLEGIGYDVKGATVEIERMLKKTTAGLSPIDMLGVVAAGEHGLYSFARAFIRLPAIRNAMNPQVKHLFLYHLLEEAEHGAVSHDQYRYFVGNNYFHRLKTAFRARHTFSMLTHGVKTLSGQLDTKITWRNRLALLSYLWIYPGLFRSMVGNLLSYAAPWYRLTFNHEDQKDIQKWNDELYAGQTR
jgi:predicted metal-dependent hydrolase